MSYIEVRNLTKTFTVRKKREKGRLFREKASVHREQRLFVCLCFLYVCASPFSASGSSNQKVVPQPGSLSAP